MSMIFIEDFNNRPARLQPENIVSLICGMHIYPYARGVAARLLPRIATRLGFFLTLLYKHVNERYE
jgi:hypothetical protein